MQKRKFNYAVSDFRKCKECKETFPILNFPTAGKKNGVEYRRDKCSTCDVKTKQHRRGAQRQWLNEYKEQLECAKCGYSKSTHESFDVSALQFHHARDNKDFMVSNGAARGMSKKKLLNEINKCIVLCCRCHAEIHKYGNEI